MTTSSTGAHDTKHDAFTPSHHDRNTQQQQLHTTPETRHDVSKIDVNDFDDVTSASSDVTEQQRLMEEPQGNEREHFPGSSTHASAFRRPEVEKRKGGCSARGSTGHVCSASDRCDDDTLSEHELDVDAETDLIHRGEHTPVATRQHHSSAPLQHHHNHDHHEDARHETSACETGYTPRRRHEIRLRNRPQSMRMPRYVHDDMYAHNDVYSPYYDADVRSQRHRLGYLDLEPPSPASRAPPNHEKYNYIKSWAHDVTIATNDHETRGGGTLRRQNHAYDDVIHAERAEVVYSDDDDSGSEVLSPPHYDQQQRLRAQHHHATRTRPSCSCACSYEPRHAHDDVMTRRCTTRMRDRVYESEDSRGMRPVFRLNMYPHQPHPPLRPRRNPSADRAYESEGGRGMRYPTARAYPPLDPTHGGGVRRERGGFRNEAFAALQDIRESGSVVSYAPTARTYEMMHEPGSAHTAMIQQNFQPETSHYMRMDGVRASQHHVMNARRQQHLQPIREGEDESPLRCDVTPRRMAYTHLPLRSLENVRAGSVYSDAVTPPYTKAPTVKRDRQDFSGSHSELMRSSDALTAKQGRKNFEPLGEEDRGRVVEEGRGEGKENGTAPAKKGKKKKIFGLCGGPMMLRKQKMKQQPLYNK